ncbi:metabolite traffic protein EboE [Streptomyces zagrosensis]|uniref:Sugar phosphate isomerase/epimerase n=1 Tax=Streptomyces zagrosensis TaxID=1042984 RepID=A0A7W9QGA7_9ACTN|nr:metabolite traffic protein EboE [Streptomyces zagrosensis]MBB5939746.1 sugar phosphate isomerase/epimerase [Streptomyces zagrosensis]
MRLRHPDGTTVHLAYCTNVHPAEDLDGILRQLATYAAPVRERLGAPVLGVGLWLPYQVVGELTHDAAALDRLRDALSAHGLEVVTLNGFPYGGFHQQVVKRAVYIPDWSHPARLAYTLDLAHILAALLPDDAARGSISTLPLGWRTSWTPARHDRALRALDTLAAGLADLRHRTGRTVRVGLEPEPGCEVGTVRDACARLNDVDATHIGVCLDACHLATDFEDPGEAARHLAAAGLPVVKAQLSCALQADAPNDPAVRRALTRFAEPRYLHQTRAGTDGPPRQWDDLDQALRTPVGTDAQPRQPWRVHFHVPLHAPPEPPLTSTRPVLDDTIRTLLAGPHPRTDHLEVETYCWSVLPGGHRPPDTTTLVTGIAAELAWARDHLIDAGLKETLA